MAKIYASMEASFGDDCCGCSYGSDKKKEFEVSDEELSALQKINKNRVTSEEMIDAIKDGNDILSGLHYEIKNAVEIMIENYWLFEADNEYEYESMEESLKKDLRSRKFHPDLTAKKFEKKWQLCESDEERQKLVGSGAYGNCYDYDYDDNDDDAKESRYHSYLMNAYHDWVFAHDNCFIAERVGCDLDACYDCDWSYTITFEN